MIIKKLVRDRIPKITTNKTMTTEVLDDFEFANALANKIVEETYELKNIMMCGDPNKIKEEIADVYEVLINIQELFGFNLNDIENIRNIKKTNLGGFKERLFSTYEVN